MTNKEAKRWLHPTTSAMVIADYRKYYGEKATLDKLNEAILVACKALDKDDKRRKLRVLK